MVSPVFSLLVYLLVWIKTCIFAKNSKSQSIMKKKSFKQPAFLSIVCLLLGISLFWFTTSKIDDLKIEQDAYNTSFWTFYNMADEGKITNEKAQIASLNAMGMSERTEKEITIYSNVRLFGSLAFAVGVFFFGAVAYIERRKELDAK